MTAPRRFDWPSAPHKLDYSKSLPKSVNVTPESALDALSAAHGVRALRCVALPAMTSRLPAAPFPDYGESSAYQRRHP